MAGPTETPGIDLGHLERARELSERGWGHVHPNPLVGCVLERGGAVIGEGWHARYGGDHAEVAALRSSEDATGATAYVTLEPCNHHGQTPPCARALLEAGVARVVYGASEPGTAAGGGAETLRDRGVEVVGPVWDEARSWASNPAFFHRAVRDTPFVALKLAVSSDGMIAAAPGRRTRITGSDADREVHRLRSGFDAVLVGAGTRRADDPRLTVRLAPPGRRTPRRMVVAPAADLPADAALLEDLPGAGVDLFCAPDASEDACAALEARGVSVHAVPGSGSGLDISEVLTRAHALGVESILCEGGATLAATLLEGAHVHRVYLFTSPHALGPDGVPAFPRHPSLAALGFERILPELRFGVDALATFDRVGT